jgi:hypothetical protein
MARIGVLEPAAAKNISDRLAAFKQGLRDFVISKARISRLNTAMLMETKNV